MNLPVLVIDITFVFHCQQYSFVFGRIYLVNRISCFVPIEDMRAERNMLLRDAYPELKQFCSDLDLDFKLVDMRWGVTDIATNDHETERLCLTEVANCRRLSLGTNFVVSKKINSIFMCGC